MLWLICLHKSQAMCSTSVYVQFFQGFYDVIKNFFEFFIELKFKKYIVEWNFLSLDDDDLDSNCLTLMVLLKDFLRKLISKT